MKLTDKQLADLEQWAWTDLDASTGSEVQHLVDEVRALRLTDDERATLRSLRLMLACGDAVDVTKSLALINRLIGG